MTNIKYPIETERLIITPYKKEYQNALYLLKQLPETHRYNYTSVPSKEEISKVIKELSCFDYQNLNGRVEYAILDKESGDYMGLIGLKGGDFKPDSTAEIYYTIHPDYFGKGYGTEAVKGILGFCFNVLNMHRIWAGATCENIASWRIMEKVGMRRECLWIHDRPKPGVWVEGKGYEKTGQWEDGYGYAILKDEFDAFTTESSRQ